MKFYDNTRLKAYKTCPRKFYLRHVKHWKLKGTPIALAFGAAWHKMMDVAWSGGDEDLAILAWQNEMADQGLSPEVFDLKVIQNEGTARAMFRNYMQRYKTFLNSINVIGIEKPFAVPLGETDKVFYVGRVDKVYKQRDRIHFDEHKTSSEYKENGPFRARFMTSFSPNSQIDGYLYTGNLLYGRQFKGIKVDAALVHKTKHDGFTKIPIERQFAMLDAWLDEAQTWVRRITEDFVMLDIVDPNTLEYLPSFPRNTESCSAYRGCSYKDVCTFIKNPYKLEEPPEGFVVEKWEPYDELKLAEIGMEK